MQFSSYHRLSDLQGRRTKIGQGGKNYFGLRARKFPPPMSDFSSPLGILFQFFPFISLGLRGGGNPPPLEKLSKGNFPSPPVLRLCSQVMYIGQTIPDALQKFWCAAHLSSLVSGETAYYALYALLLGAKSEIQDGGYPVDIHRTICGFSTLSLVQDGAKLLEQNPQFSIADIRRLDRGVSSTKLRP